MSLASSPHPLLPPQEGRSKRSATARRSSTSKLSGSTTAPQTPPTRHDSTGYHVLPGQARTHAVSETAEEQEQSAREEPWSDQKKTQETSSPYLNLGESSGSESPTKLEFAQVKKKTEQSRIKLPLPHRPTASNSKEGNHKSTNTIDVHRAQSDQQKIPLTNAEKQNLPVLKLILDGDADHSTWNGRHVEDQLTEHNIKNGLYDKAHVLNEANPAKPTVAPHVKQKPALQALSSLVISVLEKRQSRGRVTASSTFKPPPRVTLTDSKREAWLRELANASTPLRRLSRTIPHGIRGKTLLDHCLDKKIPIKRAVWLAQCVGANEMRAFKRKGISGAVSVGNELKWIRDWTVLVEQFIASLLGMPNKIDWKVKFTYGIQLAYQLYAEGLLDRDHFLQWHIQHMQFSPVDSLPLSLIMVQMYRKECLATSRCCNKLANVCLQRLIELQSSPDTEIFANVIQRVEALLANIAQSGSDGFVVLKNWIQGRSILEGVKESVDLNTARSIADIVARNDRLHGALYPCDIQEKSTLNSILEKLGRLRRLPDLVETVSSCLNVVKDPEHLIHTAFRWASSVYEFGCAKALLCSGIIRELRSRNVDTDTGIIASLASFRNVPGSKPRVVCRVLIELIKTDDFDVGRYLRWLIASGALNNCTESTLEQRADIILLREMPLDLIPSSQARLRDSLLRRLTFPVTGDAAMINQIQQNILMRWNPIPTVAKEVTSTIKTQSISLAVASAIGKWVRETLMTSIDYTLLDKDAVERGVAYDRTVEQILFLRDTLESLEEYEYLSDVLRRALPNSDTEVLMLCIRAIDANAEEFCAIGTFEEMVTVALDQYRNLRMKRPPIKDLPQAFLEMQPLLNLGAETLTYLQHEITLSEQITSVIAFTPASDAMTESSQSSPSGLEEEIERLITATTGKAKQTIMQSLQLIEKEANHQKYSHEYLVRLLVKIKGFDQASFGDVLNDWFVGLLAAVEAPFESMFQLVIGANVHSMSETILFLRAHLHKLGKDHEEQIAAMSVRLLKTLIGQGSHEGKDDAIVMLQYRKHGRKFCQQQTQSLIDLLHLTLKHNPNREDWSELFESTELLSSFRQAILKEPLSCGQIINLPLEVNETAKSVGDFVVRIFDPQPFLDIPSCSTYMKIHRLFTYVDEFSLPFYKFGLRHIICAAEISTSREEVINCINDAITSAMSRATVIWTGLLTAIDAEIAREIHCAVAKDILRKTNLDNGLASLHASDAQDFDVALKVLDATAFALPDTGLSELVAPIIDSIQSVVAACQKPIPGLDDSRTPLIIRVQALLHVTLIELRAFRNTATGMVDLAQVLCMLVATSETSFSFDTASFVYDTTATVTLELEDVKLDHIARSLPSIMQQPQLRYLLSVRSSSDDWLYAQQSNPLLFTSTLDPGSPFVSDPSSGASRQQSMSHQNVAATTSAPFPLRRWEVFPDSTPNVGANDTALSLKFFNARRVL